MLVLSRRQDQAVIIQTPDGSVVTVRVLRGGGQVKLGFEGPDEVVFLREEIALEPAGVE